MPASIFILNGNSKLTEVKQSKFDYESTFQELVANHPELLPGELINPERPRRWILVKREMGIPDDAAGGNRWSLDHLFLDQDGIPTLVEVKTVGDPRARREVVAQMLDYAANAVLNWKVETIQACYEEQCRASGIDSTDTLESLIDPEHSADEFWDSVKTNLEAQKIRMIFLADIISEELKTIVTFLNRQMNPAEVLAVELRYFTDKSKTLQTLVPTLHGVTAAQKSKRNSASSSGETISREEYFQMIDEQASPNRLASVQCILAWAERKSYSLVFNRGDRDVVFRPFFMAGNKAVYPIECKHRGRLVFQMSDLARYYPPFNTSDTQKQLETMLTKIPGFEIRGGMTGKPYIDIDKLETVRDRESLIQVLDWICEKLETPSV